MDYVYVSKHFCEYSHKNINQISYQKYEKQLFLRFKIIFLSRVLNIYP